MKYVLKATWTTIEEEFFHLYFKNFMLGNFKESTVLSPKESESKLWVADWVLIRI